MTFKITVRDKSGRIILDNLTKGSIGGLNVPLLDGYLKDGHTIAMERDWPTGEVKSPESTQLAENEEFPKEDWRYDVANGDTNLGYLSWIEHNRTSSGKYSN